MISFALLLGACTVEVPADDLVDDPDAVQGAVVVRGAPHAAWACSAVRCEQPGEACNYCTYQLVYGEGEDAIVVEPADDWVPVGPALGEVPISCESFDRACTEGVELGCHGNELEANCSPAVPSRIVAMHGVLEGRTLRVSSVELADGPHEETVSVFGAPARLYE